MRYLFVGLLLLVAAGPVSAEKPPLDQMAPACWPTIASESVKISNNGKYVAYTVATPEAGSKLVVQATDGLWKKEIPSATEGIFSADSRHLYFSEMGKNIGMVELGKRYRAQSPERDPISRYPSAATDNGLHSVTGPPSRGLVLPKPCNYWGQTILQ